MLFWPLAFDELSHHVCHLMVLRRELKREPTTGLHFSDVSRLIDLLMRLVDRGNTVLVIEHHLDVVKSADWVIDLGPEGGERGGMILAQGTPEDVALVEESFTGQYLAKLLS